KDLVRDAAKSSPEAVARIRQHHPRWRDQQFDVFPIKLTDAQLVIAREHSFETWPEFARHVRNLQQMAADAGFPATSKPTLSTEWIRVEGIELAVEVAAPEAATGVVLFAC